MQPAHYKGSWRAMKEATKWRKTPSKLCYKCNKNCTHYSVGELTFCRRYDPKDEE